MKQESIPALSQKLIEVSHQFKPGNELVLFQPNGKINAGSVLVARSIHNLKNKIFCNVVNIANNELKIDKDVLLGKISILDAHNCQEIDAQINRPPMEMGKVVDSDTISRINNIPLGEKLSDAQKS